MPKKLGVEEGYVLKRPLVEFYYKSDALDDPMISPDYGEAFGFATDEQIAKIREMALKINAVLKDFLAQRKVRLIDFKSRVRHRQRRQHHPCRRKLLRTPAACGTGTPTKKLDKDRFRRDMGNVEEAYHEVIRRLTGEGK